MKMIVPTSASTKLGIFLVIACFTGAFGSWASAKVPSEPLATVQAIRGTANVTVAGTGKPVKLSVDRTIDVSNTVHTQKNGKLLLRWYTGLLTSLGSGSTKTFGQRQAPERTVNVMTVNHGLLRVTKLAGGGNSTPYEVKTSEAVIEPMYYGKPVDFIVDASSPTKSTVTVLDGMVRLKDLRGNNHVVTIVTSCHVGSIDRGRLLPVAPATKVRNLTQLLDNATIPGTVGTWFACPVPAWRYRGASDAVAVPRQPARLGM